jgi:asparagine synthase (glutamine-hydrolysing)
VTLWLRGQLRPLCEQLLGPTHLAAQGLFRPEFHDLYVRPHLDGAADHTNKIWAMLMFQLWHRTFIEADGSAPLNRPIEAAA